MLIQAQGRTYNLGTGRNRRHIIEVHEQSVAAIVRSAVRLGTHIQILTPQRCIIGSCLHGIDGINFVQGLTGNNGKGRVDFDREYTVFIVDPFRVGFYRKYKTVFGFIQRKYDIFRNNTGIVLHIRNGNFIYRSSLFIQEADGAVLILFCSQAIQIQQEVVTVTRLLGIHYNLLFQIVTIGGVEKVCIREYILVDQRRLQFLRNNIFHIPSSALLKVYQRGIALHNACGGVTVVFQYVRFPGFGRFFQFRLCCFGSFRFGFIGDCSFRLGFLWFRDFRLCLWCGAFRLRHFCFSGSRGFFLTVTSLSIGFTGSFIRNVLNQGLPRHFILIGIILRRIKGNVLR